MSRIGFRELKPYTSRDIARAFGVDQSRANAIVHELLSMGIIKRQGDIASYPEIYEKRTINPETSWQFCYVGIVIVDGIVIIVYPKYFKSRQPSVDEMRQIMKVVRTLPRKAQITSYSIDSNQSNDLLSLMLELLDRYAEYGIYENYLYGHELNGRGAIDWVKTVNDHSPILTESGLAYIEYESRTVDRDDSDVITRLHRAVLTECSHQLAIWGIDDLLSIDEISLSDESVSDFGDIDILEWVLNRERSVQFVTWKQGVLDLLDSYLIKRSSENNPISTACLGSTSFYHVWELACSVAFGDKLRTRIDGLGLRLCDSWTAVGQKKLIDIIPKPKWELPNRDFGYVPCKDVDTLIPDAITICERADGTTVFCIYDAKYYSPLIDTTIRGQPGVDSITKQFLYQSAYRGFISDHEFQQVVNAFLIPTSGKAVRRVARVSFPHVIANEEPPFANYVDMWELPAAAVFGAYLNVRRVDDTVFRGIWDSAS